MNTIPLLENGNRITGKASVIATTNPSVSLHTELQMTSSFTKTKLNNL